MTNPDDIVGTLNRNSSSAPSSSSRSSSIARDFVSTSSRRKLPIHQHQQDSSPSHKHQSRAIGRQQQSNTNSNQQESRVISHQQQSNVPDYQHQSNLPSTSGNCKCHIDHCQWFTMVNMMSFHNDASFLRIIAKALSINSQ